MTHEARKMAYLGGIGTMLTQSNICPTCGRIHETGLMKFIGGGPAELRTSATPPETSPSGYAPIGEFTGLPASRRSRSLAGSWPMPPVMEEY